MKFHTIIPLILTLSLLGCQTPPADMTSPAPTASHTPIPTAAPTLTPTPTDVPLESLPVEEIVQKYLAGEIDTITNLTFEMQNAFRAELAEQLKETSKVRVVFTDPNTNQQVYLDWETGTMRKVEEGGEQTIVMIREISANADGSINLHEDGQANLIAGSQHVTDWNEIITDKNSSSVDWPKTTPGNSGLPGAQWFLTLEGKAYTRVVFGEKRIIKTPIKLAYDQLYMIDTLPFYKIITDQDGNPLYARLVLTSAAGRIDYFEEGGNLEAGSKSVGIETGSMWKHMEENSVYLAGFEIKQKEIIDAADVNFNFTGKTPQIKSGEVLLGTKEDDNLLHILIRMLIKVN